MHHRVIDTGFRLYGEFYTEKYSNIFSWNVLTRVHRGRKKKNTFCTPTGRDDQITTIPKFLDITYESYGFSGDLLKIQHGKAN